MTPHEFYDGSTIFQPVSRVLGLSIDKVNFLVCQLTAVLLGFPFRRFMGPHLVSPTLRHITEVIVGVWFAYFCFGRQILHLVAQSLLSLVLMKVIDPSFTGIAVLVVAMSYLSICHIYRMIYDYGGYTLDITGPLMISTQRLISLAFSLQDGLNGDDSNFSETMKKQKIQKQPSLLEFLSYIFCFHGLMCGPFCFYKDYIAFIEGTNYMPTQTENDNGQPNDQQSSPPPAPEANLTTRLVTAAVFGVSTIFILPYFPVTLITGPEFNVHGFFMKNLLINLVASLERHKYYVAWKLGEAANVSCGLGFSGYTPSGCAKWDLIDNVDIVNVEFATSPKMCLDNWNISTMKWLKYVVYDRWRNMSVVLLFSACWHGFYGGYFLAAVTILLTLLAAKKLRRVIRPYCVSSLSSAFAYDVLTFLITRICISYVGCGFMILAFEPAFIFYSQVYFWIQSLCVAIIILL